MIFNGRISKVMAPQTGVSQRTGNEWTQQEFVFEYFENPTDRYSDKVCLRTFDKKIMERLHEGQECRIGFGHSVREHEGRVFNELRMYSFETAVASAMAHAQPVSEEDKNMPF